MPGVALHFVLAEQALGRLRSSRGDPPFDVGEPTLENAFFHGAIGPDLGYFPGGDRFLSDLSHCVRTGVLTRTLVDTARTPMERAFAWGWLTHFLADREIHPLVGRAVGEQTYGSHDRFVDGASDPVLHLRVEVGLDCWYAARHKAARARRLTPSFDDSSVVFLQRVYAETYGVTIPRETFLRSHRHASRRATQSVSTLWAVGALTSDAAWRVTIPWLRRVLEAGHAASALRGLALGYLTPVDPSEWLLEKVSDAVSRHARLFDELLHGGLDDLADVNLDTGRPIASGAEHPGALAAHRELARLSAARPGDVDPDGWAARAFATAGGPLRTAAQEA